MVSNYKNVFMFLTKLVKDDFKYSSSFCSKLL